MMHQAAVIISPAMERKYPTVDATRAVVVTVSERMTAVSVFSEMQMLSHMRIPAMYVHSAASDVPLISR